VGPGVGGNACYDVAEKLFLEEMKHGSAGLAGNGVYLFPRVDPLRSEKNAGVGSHRGKSTDRVPPRIERAEVHVRSRNEKTESFKEISNQFQSDTYSYDYSSYESTYEGSYGNENNDSTVTSPSTLSVSAPQDAKSTTGLPEGTVAHGSEIADAGESGGHVPEVSAHDSPDAHLEQLRPAAASPAEHNT
jgi:hypothetical protein